MRRNTIIFSVSGIVLLTAVLLSFKLHRDSKKLVLAEFHEHQLMLVQTVVNGIGHFLQECTWEIQLLSSFSSFKQHDTGQIERIFSVTLIFSIRKR